MRGFLPLPMTVMESPAPGAGMSSRLEAQRLGDAQARAVEQRQHRGVPRQHPGLAVLSGPQAGVGEAFGRRHRERLGQALLDFRRPDRGQRADLALALAFQETGERARAGERPHQRAAADAVAAAVRHEGAHVARREIPQHREGDPAAEMGREKAEELADVALIGLDGLRRHPPFGAEMGEPIDDFAGGLGGRAGKLGLLLPAPFGLGAICFGPAHPPEILSP